MTRLQPSDTAADEASRPPPAGVGPLAPLGAVAEPAEGYGGGESSTTVRAGLAALGAAAFLVSLDRSIFAPLLPAIARDLRTTIGVAGLAVTAYVIPYGLFQLFYGPIADRAGKIAVVRWAVLVFAAGTALCGLAPGILTLDILRAITGACAAAVIPLSLAYIGDVVPYGRRQGTVATLMGVTSLGTALSTAVGGIVGNFLSWRALFGAYGVLSLGVTAALFLVPSTRAGGAPVRVDGTPVRLGSWGRYLQVLRSGRARLLFVLVALEGLFVQGGFTYLGAYLQDRFGLDYLYIGLLLAVYGAATVVASRLLSRLLPRVREQGLLLGGGLLLAAGFLVLAPLPDWRLFPLAMVAMGCGFSFFHSTLQVRATELVPALRGTSVALFAFSLFMGAGVGTAFMGWLATSGGYVPLVLVCGLGMLLVTLVTRLTW
jgi:predicted MFS family arabinose efflux permease